MASRTFTFPTPASNKLRGAIGFRLWEREDGAYERFFAPQQTNGPSGLNDPPRPFVLRAAHLDGVRVSEGEVFHFDLHLFDLRVPWVEYLSESLQEIGVGFLREVEKAEPLELSLEPDRTARVIRVNYLTPMELKTQGGLLDRPEFSILAARVRDRISTLAQLYGQGSLPLDFKGFGERAARVEMTRCDVRRVEAQRRSGRTGQTHSLGGFVGEAEYAGELAEFLPFLRVAQWTGAGRQTTWGKGHIALQEGVL